MPRSSRYPDALRERAVRAVFEHEAEYGSRSSAIRSVSEGFGISRESLRRWIREADADRPPDGAPAEPEAAAPPNGDHEPRVLPQRAPGAPQPALVHRRGPDGTRGGRWPSARRQGFQLVHLVSSDGGSSGDGEPQPVTFLSWDDVQRVADEADDIDATVRRELEAVGGRRALTPAPREPRRSRRLRSVVVVAATILVAIVVSQSIRERPETAAGQSTSAPTTPTAPTASATPPPTATLPDAAGPDGPRDDDVIRAVLAFSAPCWVRATADGRAVLLGTISGGTRTMRADRSLELTLGNAGGVRLLVNGDPIRTGATGEVVRFSFALKHGSVVQT